MERGDFSPCGTPTGMDSRDPFDLQQLGRNTNLFIFSFLVEQMDLI